MEKSEKILSENNKSEDRKLKKCTTGKKTIRVSVRTLVEFLLRSGDLRGSRGGFADKEAMQKGSRIHRKIQKSMGIGYRSEVSLKFEKEYEDFILVLEGRADGIFEEKKDGITVIDEIKGIYASLRSMDEPVPVHLAQAKCYAWVYAFQHGLSDIRVQMTYCQMESEEIRRFVSDYSFEELDLWFGSLLDEYYPWAAYRVAWEKKRTQSIKGMAFPFAYRSGQKQLVVDIYRTILRKKQLFVQAPTGVGKTISAVYPSVCAMGEGLCEKIFYLTAKTITRTVAQEAFAHLRKGGLCCNTLTITAKDKMCIQEDPECDPDRCPRAEGHFDRVNEALYDMLIHAPIFDREAILLQAERFRVCPYELQMDLTDFMDTIICDYNYVMNPRVRLKHYFGEGSRQGDYVFLIDEAHNLVERGRDMFSASLVKEDFLEIRKQIAPYHKKIELALSRCNRQMLSYKRACEEPIRKMENVGALILQLMNLSGAIEDALGENGEKGQGSLFQKASAADTDAGNRNALPLPEEVRRNLLEFYFKVRSFMEIHDLVDENYIIYANYLPGGNFQVRLACVNPSVNLQTMLDKGRSTVFYSATLLPVKYYREMLSGRSDDYAVYVPSPFPKENRSILISRDTSSKYTRRTEEEFRRMAGYIRGVISAKAGNYMTFFPSYRMMEDVYAAFCEEAPELADLCICQNPSMTEQQREEFLRIFRETGSETKIGFCIMGGIFGEGIDLVGESLIGVLVAGTGLPQVDDERELLRSYFEGKGKDGFDYAYRYPGMNKVLQAAGRVIRTDRDRGVIILMDDRFLLREYADLFPREWEDAERTSLSEVGERVRDFWHRSDSLENSGIDKYLPDVYNDEE